MCQLCHFSSHCVSPCSNHLFFVRLILVSSSPSLPDLLRFLITILYVFLLTMTRATCPAIFMRVCLIILTLLAGVNIYIFELYKFSSSSSHVTFRYMPEKNLP